MIERSSHSLLRRQGTKQSNDQANIWYPKFSRWIWVHASCCCCHQLDVDTKMICNHLRVHELLCLHNATALEFPPCPLIRCLQRSICSHELHYVICLFNEKCMISHPIFHLLYCVNTSHLFRRKVGIDCITIDILQTISALLNEHSSKYYFLPNLHQNLCNT